MSTPSSAVADALARWRGNLIDLTRRNPLIALRPTRSSMLALSHPKPSELWTRLVREEKKCTFWLPPGIEDDAVGTGHKAAKPLALEHIQTKPGEIVCGDLSRQALLRALTNLYRRAGAEYRERGLHILHVAFGVLQWREEDGAENNRSPLVLVPVELQRASLREPFRLQTIDEEPFVNPALIARLKQDFDFQLPAALEDLHDSELAVHLNQVEAAIAGLPGWQVENSCWLSLLSFFKGVMYRDLEDYASLADVHPLVRALSGETVDASLTPTSLPTEVELDAAQSAEKSFTILDADASQRLCLEAAARGHSFVLHGPPGTGKSQTIANLIAQCLADGKKVLFVSEKMAALEIVFNRLRTAGLGDYCLELHSHKANKRAVVQELKRCLEEPTSTSGEFALEDFDKLRQRRDQLAGYVASLHKLREPLQRSAWWAQGELIRCAPTATLTCRLADSLEMSPHWLDDAQQAVQRAQQLWHIQEQGQNYPWASFKVTERYTLKLREEVLGLLERVNKQLDRLMQAAEQYATQIGAKGSVAWLLKTGELLEASPRPPAAWLTGTDLPHLAKDLEACAELYGQRGQAREPLTQRYGTGVWSLPEGTAAGVEQAWHKASTLLAPGDERGAGLLTRQQQLRGWAADTQKRIPSWLTEAKTIEKWLHVTVPQGEPNLDATGGLGATGGLPVSGLRADKLPVAPAHDPSPHWLKRLLRLAHLASSENAPERAWVVDPSACAATKTVISANQSAFVKYHQTRDKLLETYTEQFFELELDRIAEGFAGSYRSWLRVFNMEFRRDRRAIARRTKTFQMPTSAPGDVAAASDLMREKTRLENEHTARKAVLGRYERGLATDFEAVDRAVRIAEEAVQVVCELGHDALPEKFVEVLSSPTPAPEKIRAALKRLVDSFGAWSHTTEELRAFLPMDAMPGTQKPLEDSSLSALLQYAKDLQVSLNHFAALADPVLTKAKSLPPDAATLVSDLNSSELLRKQETLQESENAKWAARFGPGFQGLNTDWPNLRKSLTWTLRVREHFAAASLDWQPKPADAKGVAHVVPDGATGMLPAAFVQLATTETNSAITTKDVRQALEQFQHALHSIEIRFELPAPQCGGVRLAVLPLADLKKHLANLRERVGELSDWIDWHHLGKRFEHLGLAEFWTAVQSAGSPREQLPDLFLKSVLTGWLDRVIQVDPALRDFRRAQHDQVLGEFRELDRKLLAANAARVLRMASTRRPQNAAPSAEIALLMREAHKKARHLPVRRLFEEIPDLLLRLKPCMLMSPLSVCQFLDPSKVQFDLIVFDEASQICPEDAVGAILRGKQVVITGDDKQLPPTDFFQQLADYDIDDDTEVEAPAFESVLDACLGAGLSPHFLRWHYRSRREGLIAYSNREFYENRLITFPGPFTGNEAVGVEFCHVPDGVYDRGGRRDNVREAQIVADLVIDHFRQHADAKTLGVIAFSQAQMFAIEDEIDRRLADAHQLEPFFKSDRLGGFFVKNLETVQGDERDVIILSVGYGRDAAGKFTMHFGPLNRQGGQRRLNVAVTRAREKLYVVSSIKAADLDLGATRAEGVYHLHRYLDFAQRGLSALEPPAQPELASRSPLEADIAQELQRLGYQVVAQVGCGGYRIDLGVVDPTAPQRFLLGIECDGPTYHATTTTRDRDRLRHEILEKLGWRLHRVWSTEWFHRRHQEVERLRAALEEAKKNVPSAEKNQAAKSDAAMKDPDGNNSDLEASGGRKPSVSASCR